MQRITVPLPGRSYPIVIGTGLLEALGPAMVEAGIGGSIGLVQDEAVAGRYGERTRSSLEKAGYRVVPIEVPSGESSKSLTQLEALYEALSAAGLDRASAVVALGGGVVGDLAGFAAATYLRGIAFVQVPTTLLAQVDASVGGKTGIDLPAGKNLVGAFHQPHLVWIDLETLATLPEPDYRSGLAEVIKYGVIADAPLLGYLERNQEAILTRQPEHLEQIVGRSCQIKAEVVGQDERESGLRAILNYGHTVGHAVETVSGYGHYLHGEAVAIGMAAAGWLSVRLGRLSPEWASRIEGLIARYGLPTRLREPLPTELLMSAMRQDKKSRGGELRFVLAREPGDVAVAPVPDDVIQEALEAIQP
jgi:3-dehydroquinate synthase